MLCTERIYCVDICHHSKRSLVYWTTGSISQLKSLQAISAQIPCGVSDSAHRLTSREVVSKKCNWYPSSKNQDVCYYTYAYVRHFLDITITNIYWARDLVKWNKILTVRILPSKMWLAPVVRYRGTNVFEERAASIFRVECMEYCVLSFGTYLPKCIAPCTRREYTL